MIKLLKKGRYELRETAKNTKMLTLGRKTYAWPYAAGVGEILVASRRKNPADNRLAAGEYRIYEVKDEPDFADLKHLELSIGSDAWQGYLLLTGLPTKNNPRRRILPTREVIASRV